MKDVIKISDILLHLGYSKTGTTTLQSIFCNLHEEEFINFLGKEDLVSDKNDFLEYKLIQKSLFTDFECDVESYLDKSKLNLLSDELFLRPNIIRSRDINYHVVDENFNINTLINDITIPKILFDFFKEHDVQILITLRNQIELIYSYFVQRYYLLSKLGYGTYEKYINFNVHQENYGLLSIYFYNDILSEYSKYFKRENINVLLFEDLVKDKNYFSEKLGDILNVDPDLIVDGLSSTHLRQKKKDEKGRYMKFIDENKEYFIPYPSEKINRKIKNLFKDNNEILLKNYNFDRSKLENYNYI